MDPKDPAKILSQGEMGGGEADFARWRAMAAACYFRLNGNKEYDEIVHQSLSGRDWGKDPSEPYLWVYMHAKGADPALVDKTRSAVVHRADELLGQIDLLLALRRVRGLKFARGAVAEQAHLAVLEAILYLGALGLGERGFDAMFVAGTEFDGIEAGGFQGPDDGLQIHIVEDVVGNGA